MMRYFSIMLVFLMPLLIITQPYIPIYWQQILYSISLSIKSWIMFSLSPIIISLIMGMFVTLPRHALRYLIAVFITLMLSNLIAICIGQLIGRALYHTNLDFSTLVIAESLPVLWHLQLPTILPLNTSIIIGLILGFFGMQFAEKKTRSFYAVLQKIVHFFLRSLMYSMPFFVLGNLVNLIFMGLLDHCLENYVLMILTFMLSACAYLCCLHLLIYRFNFKKMLLWIHNVIPPAIVAFSCISSLAALPFNLKSISNNLQQRPTPFAHAILPISTNLHTIGNCLFDTIIIFAILKIFHMPLPTLSISIIYALRLLVMKFSNAGVSGVGLIILIPVIEDVLHFTPEMISLLTAIFIICDPMISAFNLSGNNLLAVTIGHLEQK